jgi:hypothetical protein
MGLMRQRPGHTEVALREDTRREVLDTHDIDPEMNWGGRFTFGYLYDDAALEFTGFYVPEATTTVGLANVLTPGNFSSFFTHPPARFQGPDGLGLFTRTDSIALSLQTMMADAELNYRWWSRAFSGFEGIFGFRYVEYQERARIAADRGLALAELIGITDRALQANYTSRVHNHMLMSQFGYEWTCPLACWLDAYVIAKFAFGADDVDITKKLARGDGAFIELDHHSHWTFTGLYEINAGFDIVEFDKVKLRAGYAFMWLVHMDQALQQINYNLATSSGQHNDNGSVFFHGPIIELQILF